MCLSPSPDRGSVLLEVGPHHTPFLLPSWPSGTENSEHTLVESMNVIPFSLLDFSQREVGMKKKEKEMLRTWPRLCGDYYLISVEVRGELGYRSPFQLIFWTRKIISRSFPASSIVSISHLNFSTLKYVHITITAFQILFWVTFSRTFNSHLICSNLEIWYSSKLFPLGMIKIILTNVIRLVFLTSLVVSLTCSLHSLSPLQWPLSVLYVELTLQIHSL